MKNLLRVWQPESGFFAQWTQTNEQTREDWRDFKEARLSLVPHNLSITFPAFSFVSTN